MPEQLGDEVLGSRGHRRGDRSQKGSKVPKGCVYSAIQGEEVQFLRPEDPTQPSRFQQQQGLRHVVFTAETHNFPTGELGPQEG